MFLVKRDLSLDAQFKAVSDNHFNATAESVDFIHPIKSDGIVISQSSETNHDGKKPSKLRINFLK